MYKFREFIDVEKLDLSMLCKNPNAITLVKRIEILEDIIIKL